MAGSLPTKKFKKDERIFKEQTKLSPACEVKLKIGSNLPDDIFLPRIEQARCMWRRTIFQGGPTVQE